MVMKNLNRPKNSHDYTRIRGKKLTIITQEI